MKYDLYFGDCIDIMLQLVTMGIQVDAVITDPPYGTTACKWDSVISFNKMWDCLYKLRRNEQVPIILFGNEPFSSTLRLSNIKHYKYDIYWKKEKLTNVLQVKKRVGKTIENIMLFYEKQCYFDPQKKLHDGKLRTNKIKNGKLGGLIDSQEKKAVFYRDDRTRYPIDVWEYNRDISVSNIHPTQKPVALMENLIKTYTKEGDAVLDFTCGSGSTGVACVKLNRNFIGIDNDYCEKEGVFENWKWVDVTKYRIENKK